jgi:CRP/FNR family transcriptional regulator, cyclic AMP receptor protein
MKADALEKDMDGLSTIVTVPPGYVLCRAGELAREAMLIVDGTVNVIKDEVTVATLGPGDLVGELALNNDQHQRTATAVTASSCTVKVMSAQEFATLKHTSVAFADLVEATTRQRS